MTGRYTQKTPINTGRIDPHHLSEDHPAPRGTLARATYSAVAELLGINPQAVLHRLGPCRPEASWVVNAESGLPTGYQVRQLDPRLPGSRIIRTADELRRRLFDLPPKRTPGVRLLPLRPKS